MVEQLKDLVHLGRRLPVVRSAESAECGLACLTMIARYYGHDVDLNGLRPRFGIGLTGATLRHLIDIANELGFSTRALRLDVDALVHLRCPAILHWDHNHFVVLKRASSKQIVIHDPRHGAQSLTIDQVSQHFTGVALELVVAGTFRQIIARERISLFSLWSHATGLWSSFGQLLVLSIALQGLALAFPFQLQIVVDRAIYQDDQSILIVVTWGFALLLTMQTIIEAMRIWATQRFGFLLSYQVLGNVVRHLLRLMPRFFESRHVGDILSRLSSASYIQELLTRGFVTTVIDGVMAVIVITIMFTYSPMLASIVILGFILTAAVSLSFFPLQRKRQEELIAHTAREQTFLMETVRAITTVKVMGSELEREAGWKDIYASIVNSSLRLARLQVGSGGLQAYINGIISLAVIYVGASKVIDRTGFSIGMLFAFLAFRQIFTDRGTALIQQVSQWRFVGLHLERLGDIILGEGEVDGLPVTKHKPQSSGQIEIKNLSFRYAATDTFVLSDIDLAIAPGDFVAITGPSGGGKSTLVKILLGLVSPTSGDIVLDGVVATAPSWKHWRRSVGVVLQNDSLLSGSVAENISFFDPDMDIERVRAAAAQALIHDEIVAMPMEYLSLIGDMGSALSGGQRQRLLLARALYRRPMILILDEGTANLDVQNEERIADMLRTLSITRIVIAHRPALLERADRVLTIERGKLTNVRHN